VAFLKNTNVLPPVSGRTIRLDTVDSTNNYAMHMIDAATAAHGDVVLAGSQTGGKGQRSKSWYDTPGESLLMSVIVAPDVPLTVQPGFLAAAAVAVAEVIAQYVSFGKTAIKWPNDILIEDKKAVGILIENVVHGMEWQWAVVGIGINVGQQSFPEDLPHATSLRMHMDEAPQVEALAAEVADAVLSACSALKGHSVETILQAYNERLYQRHQLQAFRWGYDIIVRRVLEVDSGGRLAVRNQDGDVEHLAHGSVEWIWE
jgi:BirA family biotin operon repressor/biotin-[acetyl-CoA-carboxylase] ligase